VIPVIVRVALARGLLKLSDAILAVVEWLLQQPGLAVPKSHARLRPADLMLLASILGAGIAGIWVGIVWRAAI